MYRVPRTSFLAALFHDCDAGFVEARAYPSGLRTWLPLGQWDTLVPFIDTRRHARDNVALGIATRRDASSGTAANLAQLPALFVDLDVRPAEAIRRLNGFAFTPHIVVESGLGVHPYWLLKEPLDVRDRRGCDQATALLRRLTHALDGDPRATDVARVMRPRDSWNFKYGDPRPVVLVSLRPGAVDVSELDDFLPREYRHGSTTTLEHVIVEGFRNDTLYRCGRSLRARGTLFSEIARTLETFNATRCHPPLPASELGQLLKQVLTQPDRADFQPLARYRTSKRSKRSKKGACHEMASGTQRAPGPVPVPVPSYLGPRTPRTVSLLLSLAFPCFPVPGTRVRGTESEGTESEGTESGVPSPGAGSGYRVRVPGPVPGPGPGYRYQFLYLLQYLQEAQPLERKVTDEFQRARIPDERLSQERGTAPSWAASPDGGSR